MTLKTSRETRLVNQTHSNSRRLKLFLMFLQRHFILPFNNKMLTIHLNMTLMWFLTAKRDLLITYVIPLNNIHLNCEHLNMWPTPLSLRRGRCRLVVKTYSDFHLLKLLYVVCRVVRRVWVSQTAASVCVLEQINLLNSPRWSQLRDEKLLKRSSFTRTFPPSISLSQ